jgi:dimethylargininase
MDPKAPNVAPSEEARDPRMFTGAIVRRVPETLDTGITSADLGRPDLDSARTQHERYVEALRKCGLDVTILDAEERFPDSVFIEDTAVVTDRCAVVANPGADSRKGEIHEVERTLSELYENVERIAEPGTLDGGDVLQVGDHFYVGLTRRTNREGAEQLAGILGRYGFGASRVELRRFLHLKTGVAHLGGNDLVVTGELVDDPAFGGFDKMVVSSQEEYGANCIRVNDHVLVAEGYGETREKIRARGYEVIELEMSEFRKLDGGLSCLSLRLPGVRA